MEDIIVELGSFVAPLFIGIVRIFPATSNHTATLIGLPVTGAATVTIRIGLGLIAGYDKKNKKNT